MGVVQLDTLQEMSGGDENIRTLQAVMPLHVNLLHVIGLTSGSTVGVKTVFGAVVPFTGRKVVIRKFSELKDMTVATVGSAQLMGQTLEKRLGYGMNFVIADTDDEALGMLRTGRAQAVFTLGGWPLPTVSRHRLDSGLQLVDFDLALQPPYVTAKRNYQNLDAFNLNFLGVPNLLVTRPFKPGGAMANRVSTLGACLRRHLDELQEGRFQPGWKEIKDPDQLYGVTRFTIGPSLGIARDNGGEMSSSVR
jgi:ABC-type amino acid transport substrate-binding protein